jgi:tetratricopeptide (TPR) repeat protein
MPDIGKYTVTTELVLAEAGKYFALLLFSVLAIRLWRRWAKSPGANRWENLFLACGFTLIAAAIGYFSMCQSLGKLYSYYGMSAFHANRLPQAVALFEMSSKYWKSADALGQKGVCLLLSGNPDRGLRLIEEAKILRKGRNVPFEEFYEGLYFFSLGQSSNSVPLLEAASADMTYHWSVVKLFAVMELEGNHPADAAELMKPFMQAEVTESDQAYIIASLKLAEGKKAEAQVILNKFPPQDLSPMWKSRFEKLQAKIKN